MAEAIKFYMKSSPQQYRFFTLLLLFILSGPPNIFLVAPPLLVTLLICFFNHVGWFLKFLAVWPTFYFDCLFLLCHEHGSVPDLLEMGLLDLTSLSAAGSGES